MDGEILRQVTGLTPTPIKFWHNEKKILLKFLLKECLPKITIGLTPLEKSRYERLKSRQRRSVL
ncbi:MAG: hypothetical protein A3G09_04930 [Candidatus Moranbacteria bacterium RIFCSPLOWO2_12_FULL_48_12]|nr:MAG: hypothetical protein A3G09_04930 [Candidatus Moranbacteria bacterium RIFCSPLOWO2_12_FULL_48_12]